MVESDNPTEPGEEHGIHEDAFVLKPAKPPSGKGQPAVSDSESALRRLERDIGGGVFEQRCEERLRELAFFIDPARIQELVLARIYDDPGLYCSADPSALDSIIDHSIQDLVRMEEGGDPGDLPSEEFLAYMLGIGVIYQRVHSACRRFNGLPYPLRKTFRMVCLQGVTVDACADMGMGSTDLVGRSIYVCFEALIGDWPLKRVPRSEQPKL